VNYFSKSYRILHIKSPEQPNLQGVEPLSLSLANFSKTLPIGTHILTWYYSGDKLHVKMDSSKYLAKLKFYGDWGAAVWDYDGCAYFVYCVAGDVYGCMSYIPPL